MPQNASDFLQVQCAKCSLIVCIYAIYAIKHDKFNKIIAVYSLNFYVSTANDGKLNKVMDKEEQTAQHVRETLKYVLRHDTPNKIIFVCNRNSYIFLYQVSY